MSEEVVDLDNPEVLLIAGALMKPALAIEAARYVTHDDFQDHRIGQIWGIIIKMVNDGLKEDEIDIVGIAHRYSTNPNEQRNIRMLCSAITDGMPRATSLVLLAQRVRRRATMRLAMGEIRKIAVELQSQITSNDGDMPDLDLRLSGLSVAVHTRSDLTKKRTQYKDLGSEVSRYFDGLISGDKGLYVPTGLPTLDRYLGGGLRPGQLHVVLGGTGSGKTAFTSQLCDRASLAGKRALMFSMEVDPLDVYIRDVERVAGVSRWDLRSRVQAEREAAQMALMEAQNIILNQPRGKTVYGEPMSLEGIRQAVLTERVRGGKVDMIGVDHAQVTLPSEGELRTMPRYLQVKSTAEGLRALARQLGIAVVLTAQLNPPPKGEEPTMAMVRESKDINNAAEVVMLIFHKKEEEPMTGQMFISESWLILEKVRAGREGRIALKYDGKCFRFTEATL
jgi:replicative DNA helicase